MMKRLLATLVILTGLIGSGGDVWADEYADVLKTINSGDHSLALKVAIPRAEQGVAWAQNILGAAYKLGLGVTQDNAEALKWFRKSAEQGFAKAQNNLGWMYYNGEGVTQDYAEALKWHRKAAEQGRADAQFIIGLMYNIGKGVTQDYAEAVKWYRKAAEQGYADAQYKLGWMYARGDGVTQDYAEAVKWYRKAAEQGDAVAQHNLGVSYDNGNGVTQDNAEAVKWYRKAAEQGYAAAQYNLGVSYYNGDGVLQDTIAAYMWFNIAAANGNNAKNRDTLDTLAEELTKADIIEAQKRAKRCVASGYKDCDIGSGQLEEEQKKIAMALPIKSFIENYDFDSDLVAQVLNYSTFAAEGVTGHSVSQFEVILSLATPGAYRKYINKPERYTWRKDEKDSCVYHLAVSGEKSEDSSMSVAKIDLNSYSPKLIKFEDEYYREGWWTLVKHEIDILFGVTKGSIDSDRLIRGWTKIYSDYCEGKKSAW
ncbi:Sel1 domain protein repeat-containing protein [alpha proteobacterium BAL199]|nr:Sel1 domain protein repeat-containing protein [alpha proteobacterium BAL199]